MESDRKYFDIPPLFESLLYLLHFYGRLTLVPGFTNQKKSEDDFHFYEKRQKAKIAFSICFAMSRGRGSAQPER